MVNFKPRPLLPHENYLRIYLMGGWVDPIAGVDVWRRNICTYSGFEPQTVQIVASLCTNNTIRTPLYTACPTR
jgi:hypothetical protein